MKQHLLAGLLSASLLLAGCSALLERDYTSVTPHNAVPATEGDPSILRADSYQELVNALIYFVNGGMEAGTVRLYTDAEKVESFLSDACLEVVQEDPLGAYCVEFIKYTVDPVVAYSEAHLDITYRRTREQVASIVQATGVTAIRSELEALSPPPALCASATSPRTRPSSATWPGRPTTAYLTAPWGCRKSTCPSTPTAGSSALWRFCCATLWTTPSWKSAALS